MLKLNVPIKTKENVLVEYMFMDKYYKKLLSRSIIKVVNSIVGSFRLNIQSSRINSMDKSIKIYIFTYTYIHTYKQWFIIISICICMCVYVCVWRRHSQRRSTTLEYTIIRPNGSYVLGVFFIYCCVGLMGRVI